MAKKSPPPSKAEEIISVINSEVRQDLVILIIPSHEKDDKPLKDQDMWAAQAMELGTFSRGLFGVGLSWTDEG